MPKSDDIYINRGWSMLQQARAYIKETYGYFHIVTLGFIPFHLEGAGTLGCSKSMLLGVDFRWFGTLDVKVAGGCLIHEVMHVLRDLTRIDALPEPAIARLAADIPINDDLRAAGIELPEWVVYSDTYNLPPGLSLEAYYELLLKQRDKLPKTQLFGAGNCGSCNGGFPDPFPTEEGRTDSEVRYFKQAGIEAIREHHRAGGFGRGKLPNSLKEILEFDGTEESVVPWAQMLQGTVSRSFGRIRHGHADYSMRRPSRRSYITGIVRPGLISRTPTVMLIEDSSGSMQNRQIRENRKEAIGALQSMGLNEVWFFCADTRAQTKPRLIHLQDLLQLPTIGRGGTSFKGPIETALRNQPRPDLIIYHTDGDGDAPERRPLDVDFIWLLAPGSRTKRPASWGTTILTSNDPNERKRYQQLL
jgi:predicted metal-dependent peptidase